MSPLFSSLVPALGWALVDFLWQGALVGVAAFAVLATLRDARPQARYAVLLAAMLACVILPAIGMLRALAGGDGAAGSVLAGGAPVVAVGFDAGAPHAGDWRATVQANLPRMVSAWSLGAALLALRFALGLAWVGRLRTGGRPPDFAWQARLERIAAAVGLANPPEMRLVEGLEGPAVAGWWRPVVLMPAALLARMPADLLEALLAHELAHVRRHDYLVNLLQGAVEALLFYHPVVWWLSRRLRIEREQVADDLALRAIGEPRQLARALQCLDRLQAEAAGDRAPAHPHLAPAAHGGQLMNRIRRLVRPRPAGLHWKSGLPLIAISALGLAVYVQAAPGPVASPVSPPTTAVAPVAAAAPSVAVGTVAAAPVALAAPAAAPAPALAPLAAAVAAQAADQEGGKDRHRWAWHDGEAYALVREGQEAMLLSGDMEDMAAVKRARNHLRGDFLWFRRDGQAYVVQDPALIGAARKAWAPVEAQGRKLEALSAKMQPHAARLEELGRQMEAAHAKDAPERERLQALATQMEPIARQQQAIAERMREVGERLRDAGSEHERERLSAQMQALAAQMRPLNDQASTLGGQMGVMGGRMSASHAPLQAISEKMREASGPMQELGAQMKVLGEEQGRLSRAADASVRTVIDRALSEGKAERSDRMSAY